MMIIMIENIVDNKIVVCCVLFILFAALFICLVRFFQKFLLKSYHKKISQFKWNLSSKKNVNICFYILLCDKTSFGLCNIIELHLLKSELESGFSDNDVEKIKDVIGVNWDYMNDKKILKEKFWITDNEFDVAWNIWDYLFSRNFIWILFIRFFLFVFFAVAFLFILE